MPPAYPSGASLIQLMQNQSLMNQRDRELARSIQRDKWNALSTLITSPLTTFIGEQERKQAKADRALDREEQQARIAEGKRVAAREVSQDRRAADLAALASVSGLTLEQQRRLAHGQLESTPFVPAADEAGQLSIERGATIPAESPSRPDLVRMGEGYGRRVRQVAPGAEPVLTPARTYEDIHRFDIERAETEAAVAAAAVEDRRTALAAEKEKARLTAEYRLLQEKNRAEEAQLALNFRTASIENQNSPSETTLRRLEESASEGIKALYKGNALNTGSPSTLTDDLEEWANELRRNNFSEPVIKSIIGTSRQSVIDDLYTLAEEAWKAEQLSEMDAGYQFVGGEPPVPPAGWRADTYRRIAAKVDPRAPSPLHDTSIGLSSPSAPSSRGPVISEIVEAAIEPGGWGTLSPDDQVAEFERSYGIEAEEARDLYEKVNEAVKSILKTLESPETSKSPSWDGGWDASTRPSHWPTSPPQNIPARRSPRSDAPTRPSHWPPRGPLND